MNNKSRKESIIKDTASYSLFHYLTQGIGFVTAFLVRKFLGPYYMGIWSLLKVVLSYFSYMGLGVNTAAVYKIPFYRGKEDRESEESTKNTAFGFLFIVSLVSSALLVVAAIV